MAKNKNNIVSWLMRSYRITFMMVMVIFVIGIIGFDKMGKAEFPDFVIRQGVVVAIYPGATAEEVEVQVAKPLERYLFTFDEVKRKKTTTTSSNGMCVVMVELEDNVTNKDEVWSKLKHGLNSFKAQSLPAGVLALAVNDDFGSASALLIAIESKNRSYRDLKKYSDILSDALRRIPSVSNVVLYGDTKEQITITVDQQRLAAYGIGRTTLLSALQSAGMTTMAGAITGNEKDIPIHVKNNLSAESDIENQIIYTDAENHVVRVKDVASVKREYDKSNSSIEYNGSPCVLLSLEMAEGNNIVQYGKDVQQILDDYTSNYFPQDITVSRIADQCKVVDDSIWDFMLNLLESMIVIVIAMLLLFPWRTAIVAGITVPLSTFISIAVMYFIGIPLNTVTLAGLILVLGMVVDNSIVVLDGYLEYLGKGFSRWHAAAESANHYFMPMMLATLCISVIFFPLLLTMKGQMYDFVRWLPWTILINLMVSLLLAVVVIPVLEYMLIRKAPSKKTGKKSPTDYVQEYYEKALSWTFRYPKITIMATIGFVIVSIVLIAPNLKIRMMPAADRNQFAVEITLPQGTGLSETKSVADSIGRILRREHDVTSVTSFIGCSSPRFHTSYAPKMAGRNYAQLIVNTTSNRATVDLLDKYEPLYSEHFPAAFIKFKQLDYQTYAPFEYRFYGEDADSLRAVANSMITEMRKNKNLMNVHSDWDNFRPIYDVELDPVATSQLGMTRTTAEIQLALATGDTKIGQVWEDDYEVPLILKNSGSDKLNCDEIDNLYLTSPVVPAVPLRQFAQTKPLWTATNIIHRQGERCITVTCDLKRNVYAADIHKQNQKILDSKITLPQGVRSEVGGEPEDDAQTGGTIYVALLIAIGIIFLFVLLNFKKYKMAVTCLLAIALIIPGTLIGLFLMNRAVGITVFFGIIALMGMLMRNEILIFEHANDCVQQGMSVRDAAYDAGRRRMVPIFLTTATTAVGVVPMIIAATSFWMPVGVSIFAGGIVSLILIVLFLPVVYWKLNEKKK